MSEETKKTAEGREGHGLPEEAGQAAPQMLEDEAVSEATGGKREKPSWYEREMHPGSKRGDLSSLVQQDSHG